MSIDVALSSCRAQPDTSSSPQDGLQPSSSPRIFSAGNLMIPVAQSDILTNALLGKFNGVSGENACFAFRFGGRPIAPHGLGDRFSCLGDRKNSRPSRGTAFRTRKKGPTEALFFICTANVYKICEILYRQNKKQGWRLVSCPLLCAHCHKITKLEVEF